MLLRSPLPTDWKCPLKGLHHNATARGKARAGAAVVAEVRDVAEAEAVVEEVGDATS